MAYSFSVEPASLKRRFSVYVVVATNGKNSYVYVGKTGDNREGCNPVISRCGNHFSYNNIHSQIRNKISKHESRQYTYVFDHFDSYAPNDTKRRVCVDRINEMERWLNSMIADFIKGRSNIKLLNPHKGTARLSVSESRKRAAFRTNAAKNKLAAIVEAAKTPLGLK
jgi:hypothetical protein